MAVSGKVQWLEENRPGCKGCIHCGPTLPCEFILNTGHSPQYHGVKLHPLGIGCPLKSTGERSRKVVALKIGANTGDGASRNLFRASAKPRGRRPIIDPVKFQQMYAAGAFDSAIAEAFGVCKRSVCRYRLEHGLPSNYQKAKAENASLKLPRRRRSALDAPQILAAYRAGANDRELAAIAGTSAGAVKMWRYRRGLPSNYLPGGKKKESSGESEV